MTRNACDISKTAEQAEHCASETPRAGSAEDEPPQPSGASLSITDTTERLGSGALDWLARFGALAIAEAVGNGEDAGSVALSVVDDEKMSELHLFHSGIEGTTDVLTFDLREDESGALDVEIVVCLDEAARQSGDGEPVEKELLLYLLHGVLHCLGFDDHDPDEFERMHAREDEILNAIGVGSVFDSGGSR